MMKRTNSTLRRTRSIVLLLVAMTLAGCERNQNRGALAQPTAAPQEQPTAIPQEQPTAVPEEQSSAVPQEQPSVVSEQPAAVPESVQAAADASDGTTITKLVDRGGRVDWYKGDAHSLIAYDALGEGRGFNTEVYTIESDGSEQRCVTCDTSIPKGFIGQPAWHPNGEYIVVQAENANSQHRLYNHMAWGINNDLWLVKRDGTAAEQIWTSALNNGALHPHFSEDGTKLIFSERVATNQPVRGLRLLTPGGENPWAGWQIHIADFNIDAAGPDKLSNHRTLSPNGSGFYEVHGLNTDGTVVYSFTAGGEAYVDDSYRASADGSNVENLINSPNTWDEHGSYSPSKRTLAFISSRMESSWVARRSRANTLRTELFLKDEAGAVRQITAINQNGDPNTRTLVSDFSWDREGQRIVFQAAPLDRIGIPQSPQLWIVTFPSPQ